jgi:hypothetical protein
LERRLADEEADRCRSERGNDRRSRRFHYVGETDS